MIDQPAVTPLPDAAVPGDEITLTDLFFPWEDLRATGVPARRLTAHPQVILTLSMLAGMRDGVPSLVQTDGQGRLISTGDREIGPTMNCPPAQVTTQAVFTPSGTDQVELKLTAPGAPGINSTVTVTGHKSGWVYYPATAAPTVTSRLLVDVDPAQDSQVDVAVNNGNGVQQDTVLITLHKK